MASSAHTGNLPAPHRPAVADRLIGITTALAVAAVAAVAAVISYRHAYELVTTHGETGLTARLLPFTVDGLILAASMLILDASRRHHPVPPLARWCLGAGIAATIGANLAHGLGHGPIGALVSAWPALALAGSFELLMTLIRSGPHAQATAIPTCHMNRAPPTAVQDAPPVPASAPAVEQTIRAWHRAGRSQRAIARDLGIDRRKIKRIIDHPPDHSPATRAPRPVMPMSGHLAPASRRTERGKDAL
jgi:hypothetical protein